MPPLFQAAHCASVLRLWTSLRSVTASVLAVLWYDSGGASDCVSLQGATDSSWQTETVYAQCKLCPDQHRGYATGAVLGHVVRRARCYAETGTISAVSVQKTVEIPQVPMVQTVLSRLP